MGHGHVLASIVVPHHFSACTFLGSWNLAALEKAYLSWYGYTEEGTILYSSSSLRSLDCDYSYVAGSANGFSGPDSYNGNDLVRESGDGVIAVVIQYRLGLFGFLAGKEVKANGRLNAGLRGSSGSFSTLVLVLIYETVDQQFALQWVQEHVSRPFSCICLVVALTRLLIVRRSPSSAGIPAESLSGANQLVRILCPVTSQSNRMQVLALFFSKLSPTTGRLFRLCSELQ